MAGRRGRTATEGHGSTARAIDDELLVLFVDEHLSVTEAAARLGYDRAHISRVRNTPGFRNKEDALRNARATERKAARDARLNRAYELLDDAADGEKLTDGQWRFVDKFIPNARTDIDVTSKGESIKPTPESIAALVAALKGEPKT